MKPYLQYRLVSVYADLLSAACDMLELNAAVNQCKESIVGSATYIVAGMDLCASLSNDDVSCDNCLTVSLLNAESLTFAVTSVLCGTYTFFMCKKL